MRGREVEKGLLFPSTFCQCLCRCRLHVREPHFGATAFKAVSATMLQWLDSPANRLRSTSWHWHELSGEEKRVYGSTGMAREAVLYHHQRALKRERVHVVLYMYEDDRDRQGRNDTHAAFLSAFREEKPKENKKMACFY